MIPLIEIKEKAVAEGVPETTVIKDYALSWMLKALNDVSDAFALKGGTGIRKAYIEGYRFSVDLDFTLTESVDVREVLLEAVRLARRESGIEFGKALGLKSVRTGYEARVMFRLYYHFPMKIKIDVTTPENEVIVQKKVRAQGLRAQNEAILREERGVPGGVDAIPREPAEGAPELRPDIR